MKRRTFCNSAVSALVASLPGMRLLAQDLKDLAAGFKGQVLAPGHAGYDDARKIWNGAFDKKPGLIARCADATDVTRAVNFARTHRMLVAVRSGGHSLPGHSVCDGGLMIDLSSMRNIHVDVRARTARIGPGVLLGELDRETQRFNLATPLGTVSKTGAAGLTLGGGFGRLARRFGLACDNLIAADVITADGRSVRATPKDNPDLLWGLRGGGGNFGVVTSFEYQLHSVEPEMYGGALLFPYKNPRALLRSYADFIAGASDNLFVMLDIVPTPDGQRIVAFEVCHSGSRAEAEKDIATLRRIGTPAGDALRPAMYVELQKGIDKDYPVGRAYYMKSGFIRDITPPLIDSMVDYLEAAPFAGGIASILQHGGAIARVKPDATAYWHREANHSALFVGVWDDPKLAERAKQWTRDGWSKIEPLTAGFYVNLSADDESQRRVRATYGDNYTRLAALKKQYDPTNLFRLNANLEPG